MAVLWPLDSCIPLEEEEKPSDSQAGILLVKLVVVLVERVDRQSVAGLGPRFFSI
jgi:hypothetical protein